MVKGTKDLFKNTHRRSMALTIDYVFHAVFGRDTDESRAALMEILNIILERKDDPIKSIILKNPIDTAEREDEKETIMDIRAETNSGEELDIEMQSGNLRVYPDRILFYGGRLVNSSLQHGLKYDKMKKSIVVSIINGILFSETDCCHSIFDVRERETGLLLSDRLEFHFLELGKVDGDKPVEKLTQIESLAAYLKYANDEDRQDYVQEIISSEGLTMTENAYRKVTQDEIEYERMESRLKYQLQYNTDMSLARQEGLELGLEQGRTEGEAVGIAKGEATGRREMKLEIARAMKAEDIDCKAISRMTGLSAEEIEKL
ncbi:MAG: Rpn family recombination-promoting nuclease/putative transposase [Firmicutes bacterium]|nr:Rpn family recombination-promoting nuclease/putative transposase [Bacillota bacterium]